jgi:hypothetical protein
MVLGSERPGRSARRVPSFDIDTGFSQGGGVTWITAEV